MKICDKIVVLGLSMNIIKAAELSIPANKITIRGLFDKYISEFYRTESTDVIVFKGGEININDIIDANKHRRSSDGKNIKDINTENYRIGLTRKCVNNEYELYIVPKTEIQEGNIIINVNGKEFKNKGIIIDFLTEKAIKNSLISYSSANELEIEFINIFRDPIYYNGKHSTNLYTEINPKEYCIKNYTCCSTNLDFSKKEPTYEERITIIKDIVNNKKVTMTFEKCKKRIKFYYKKGKDYSYVNKKHQPIIDIIEKYRGGRYDKDNITFKAIVDEIKALNILPNNSEISIVEQNNEGKEYNSDNNGINFNATWLITLPEICYKKDVKLNVKFISDDNDFELKKIQGITNCDIEIDVIEGYTLSHVKNILCSKLNLPDEFKENDGLTYNYVGNNTALKDNEVFSGNKVIEIHIPNTKTNLVTKKQSQKKDDDKNNNNNGVEKGEGNGNGNTESKGGSCCNCLKK